MRSFDSRCNIQIPLVDNARDVGTTIKELTDLKEFFEALALPMWAIEVHHDDYATLASIKGPFQIEEMKPDKTDKQHMRSTKAYGLWGELGSRDHYKICYPDSSRESFSVWPGMYKPGYQLLLSPNIRPACPFQRLSCIIGENDIAQQLSMWEVQDPRIERLSPIEVEEKAELLFAQKQYEAGGLVRVRDQLSFVGYAIKSLNLTGKDILRCVGRLYEKHAQELIESNQNIFKVA